MLSHQWCWPSEAPASKAGRCLLAGFGSKSLTLELTKLKERVVGGGHDGSRDLISVAMEIPSSLMWGRQRMDDNSHDTSGRGTSTRHLQHGAVGKVAVLD